MRRASRAVLLSSGFGLILFLAPSGARVDGATIQSHKQHTSPPDISGQEIANLKTFLRAGLHHWSVTHPPKLPLGLTLTNSLGSLKAGAVENFIFWTRAHHPTRFDAKHPYLGPLYQKQDLALTQLQAQLVAASVATHSSSLQILKISGDSPGTSATNGSVTRSTSAPVVLAQEMIASTVPEPSGILSTLALFGIAGGWWRRGFVRSRA